MISRRWVIGALGAGTCAAALGGSRLFRRPAAGGPCAAVEGRTIRWIVPNAAGGGYDTESRMLAPFLERRLHAAIAIDNVPGAGGVVGARAIATARPDGLTLGIVGVPGLLLAALDGRSEAPDPATGLTILARTGRSWHVWASGGASALRSLEDVRAVGRTRPLVFAVNEVGSANFASITVTAALLGLQIALVAGFRGTRQASLAALRGDVDLVCFDFETLRDLVEGGDLHPLLQVSASPIARHPSLAGVPTLGGQDGWAARVARDGRPGRKDADVLASALFAVMGSGRVIVAPPALDRNLFECLSRVAHETLVSPEMRAAAVRALDPAPADQALADVRSARMQTHLLLPIVTRAMQRVRQ